MDIHHGKTYKQKKKHIKQNREAAIVVGIRDLGLSKGECVKTNNPLIFVNLLSLFSVSELKITEFCSYFYHLFFLGYLDYSFTFSNLFP